MRVFIEDSFDSAHWLPRVPEGHKCHRLHGHTYRLRIEIGGEVDPVSGWVVDYAEVKAIWDGVKPMLDHHCLNEVPGLSNPTCEIIAQWISTYLADADLKVSRLELRETEHCGVVLE